MRSIVAISISSSLVMADDFVLAVWKITTTPSYANDSRGIKHSPCGWVITVHRSASEPPLTPIAANHVMDVFSQAVYPFG